MTKSFMAFFAAVIMAAIFINPNIAFATDTDGDGIEDGDDEADNNAGPKVLGKHQVLPKGNPEAGYPSMAVCTQSAIDQGKDPALCLAQGFVHPPPRSHGFAWVTLSPGEIQYHRTTMSDVLVYTAPSGEVEAQNIGTGGGNKGVMYSSDNKGVYMYCSDPDDLLVVGNRAYGPTSRGHQQRWVPQFVTSLSKGQHATCASHKLVENYRLGGGYAARGETGVSSSRVKKVEGKVSTLSAGLNALSEDYKKTKSQVAANTANISGLGGALADLEAKASAIEDEQREQNEAIVENRRRVILAANTANEAKKTAEQNRKDIRPNGFLLGVGISLTVEDEIEVNGVVKAPQGQIDVTLERKPVDVGAALQFGAYAMLGEYGAFVGSGQFELIRANRGYTLGGSAFLGLGNPFHDGSPVVVRAGLEVGGEHNASGLFGELSGFGPSLPGVHLTIEAAAYVFFRPVGLTNLPVGFVKVSGGGLIGGIWPVMNGESVWQGGKALQAMNHQAGRFVFAGGFTF